jgi:proliferating cell nuclear antigen
MPAIIQQDTLTTYFETAYSLVDETRVHLTPEGFHISAVDPANVAMLEADLAAGAFESYEFDGGTIGVNIERLLDLCSVGDSGDLVYLTLNGETRKLELEIGGFEATMALIDPDAIRNEPDLPDLDLPARVVCEGSWLADAVDAADLVSDHISFGADPDAKEFWMSAQGDTDDVRWALGDEDLINASVDGEADSIFSLDYLDDMTGVMPGDASVAVRLGEEFPIRLQYDMADGVGEVEMMCAPRIHSG